jgi:hypothetical protein
MDLYQELAASAAQDSPHLRRPAAGAATRQGDVYCHPIKSRPAAWSVENAGNSRQVATGQTVGSRHMAEGPVKIYWPEKATDAAAMCPVRMDKLDRSLIPEALGPVIVAEGPWTLTHPEHAHHAFPAGTYLVTYQIDLRTLRRVVD